MSHAMRDITLGFVGAGNMAGALIKGLLGAGLLPPGSIVASDVRPARLDELAAAHRVRVTTDNQVLAAACDVVVLATKPQAVPAALAALGGHLRPGAVVVSIVAGVPIAALEARLPEHVRVVRTMPNTPALALAGATAIAPGTRATAEDLALVRALFEAVGKVVTLDEAQLDAVTGLSGSGPAYVFLIIEALADGGVRKGLARDVALTLAAQTVYGAAKLLLETGEHPARLKDQVTSPGGTTIAGLAVLEKAAVRGSLIAAVEAATQRSEELGRATAMRLGTKGSEG